MVVFDALRVLSLDFLDEIRVGFKTAEIVVLEVLVLLFCLLHVFGFPHKPDQTHCYDCHNL